MSKNDDRILELKKQIETKKKSISEKKIRFIPETNCVLNMDGMTINLNAVSYTHLEVVDQIGRKYHLYM